jgi:GAF domain-containing protein
VAELKAAAELCTGFGTARDISDLQSLLGQAATLIDASGLIVWLGSATGADLRPVLAHGYTDETLDRMKAIPQSADNATAQAYRSGRLQIVLARPGVSPGAVVVPLLSPDGTIGALTAEITGGAEASDSVQALAAILAAQLATVLAPSAEAVETHDQSHDQSASA